MFPRQEGDAKGRARSSSSRSCEVEAAASGSSCTKPLCGKGPSSLRMAAQSRRLMMTFYKNARKPGMSIRKTTDLNYKGEAWISHQSTEICGPSITVTSSFSPELCGWRSDGWAAQRQRQSRVCRGEQPCPCSPKPQDSRALGPAGQRSRHWLFMLCLKGCPSILRVVQSRSSLWWLWPQGLLEQGCLGAASCSPTPYVPGKVTHLVF